MSDNINIIGRRLGLFGEHAKLARRAVWRVKRSMILKKMTVITVESPQGTSP